MDSNNTPIILLVGNPNIGKSVLFNSITGMGVTVSNYPGTTVDFTEGFSKFKEFKFKILDLPGIYSLGTSSTEQIVTRNKILELKDKAIIINVVDASNLERNLILTLELLELEVPMIVCLNMIDEAEKKGIKINYGKLHQLLGIPVVPTIAVRGYGLEELIKTVILVYESKTVLKPARFKFGKDVENVIESLELLLVSNNFRSVFNLSEREIAIRLLEKDPFIIDQVKAASQIVYEEAVKLAGLIEAAHGENSTVRIMKERNALAAHIASIVKEVHKPVQSFKEKLNVITTRPLTGIPIAIAILIGLFSFLVFGGSLLEELFKLGWAATITPLIAMISSIISNNMVNIIFIQGLTLGVEATLSIVLPYVFTFYIILGLMEDTGYLARITFLADSVMHKLGLHGKSVIPLMMGLGCSVPAIMSTRILETKRERVIASFIITLIPCSARISILLGVVGSYIGLIPVLLLFACLTGIVFFSGYVLNKILKGEKTGLVMEIPPYRSPQIKNILKKTWFRMKDFLTIALPLIIIGSVILGTLSYLNLLAYISSVFAPVTVMLLGLPAVTGVVFIFGVLRKELAAIMLMEVLGTTNLLTVLTPVNLIVFALVTSLYIPCIATFAVIGRELGLKYVFIIPAATILIAVIVGSLANAILTLVL
ncbi:MAG: ferrous iron transport protein B [Candidatus Odinarchaeum yellowstonii]|uniref:Ferrous iron transport protein B n=1 Tax=Odinarchaeota yellowstonii (strain LCB_4) TaxID=1841599 RepID=A0AAF0D2I3_ODILC|nr:MAG: ferrous iron transport protein B [Candidatus Odinarchaeum yellowstonii]